jgi:hypothetical protein
MLVDETKPLEFSQEPDSARAENRGATRASAMTPVPHLAPSAIALKHLGNVMAPVNPVLSDALLENLDSVLADIQEAAELELTPQEAIMKIAAGTTAASALGYLGLGLRGSSLLASLFSVLPVWRGLDPLPVLNMTPEERNKLMSKTKKDDKRLKRILDANADAAPETKNTKTPSD